MDDYSKLSYEEALVELEKCVAVIEDPDTKLADIGKEVKRATALIEYCRKVIRDNENEIVREIGN